MSTYTELRKKHAAEYNAFPFGFAFGQERYAEMMKNWGLSPADSDKVLALGDGIYLRKADKDAFDAMCRCQREEREAAIATDSTGDGYLYEMFLYELRNNEYAFTGDDSDTLEYLGFTSAQIEADSRLKHALKKAKMKIGKGVAWCL